MFIEPLIRNTTNENRNCAITAGDCLIKMEKVYGEGIFKAILESVNQDFVEKFAELKTQSAY